MNTKASQNKNQVMTSGQRLRQAREHLGLSQKEIAERLCLKSSTISDIEEDSISENIDSIFVRGYIRSYAKLLHIPEDELLPTASDQTPKRAPKILYFQRLSLVKCRKNRDRLLMILTWLIVLVILGLTGVWWWQNH